MRKILTILSVLICCAANIFLGLYLYGGSREDASVVLDKTAIEEVYRAYGFSLLVPEYLDSQGPRPDINLLESFFLDTPKDIDPVLEIMVFDDTPVPEVANSSEYRSASQYDFENNEEYKYKYYFGGIVDNPNGVKLYIDVASMYDEDDQITTKFKMASFFNNDRHIMLFWQDSIENFSESVKEFDAIIDSVKVFEADYHG